MKSANIFLVIFMIITIGWANKYETKDIKNGFIKVRDSQIYYEEVGTGEPLILAHAGYLDSRMWDDQFLFFANNGYKVIRFDSFAHGKSNDGESSPLFDEIIKKLVDELNLGKVNIAGVSMGGSASIDFTLEYPEKVNSLILISTGIYGYKWQKDKVLLPLLQELMINLSEENITKSADVFLKSWTDGPRRKSTEVDSKIRNKIREMIMDRFKNHGFVKKAMNTFPKAIERFKEIDCPVLIINGELDMPSINEISNLLNKGIKKSELIEIKAAGHMLNMEKPEQFNNLLLSFLKRIR